MDVSTSYRVLVIHTSLITIGWMAVKLGLSDCLLQSKNTEHHNISTEKTQILILHFLMFQVTIEDYRVLQDTQSWDQTPMANLAYRYINHLSVTNCEININLCVKTSLCIYTSRINK